MPLHQLTTLVLRLRTISLLRAAEPVVVRINLNALGTKGRSTHPINYVQVECESCRLSAADRVRLTLADKCVRASPLKREGWLSAEARRVPSAIRTFANTCRS